MLLKYMGLFLTLVLLIASVQAQAVSSFDYDCDVVADVLAAIDAGDEDTISELSQEIIAEDEDGKEISFTDYVGIVVINLLLEDSEAELTSKIIFESATVACGENTEIASSETSPGDTFNIVVNGNVNLRSCGTTDCEVVGQAVNGSIMVVVGQENDWYEVEFEGGTAFIASWLTTRGPDELIQIDDIWRDETMGCAVVFDIARGDTEINFIIAGDRRNDIFADIYRPNESNPLRVEGQLNKTFTDTGKPYIYQYYNWGLFWPLGIYQLEITIDDETRILAWEMKERSEYSIFVVCN